MNTLCTRYLQWSHLIFTNTKIVWNPLYRCSWGSNSCLQANPEALVQKEQVPMVCSTCCLVHNVTSVQEILNPWTLGKLERILILLGKRVSDHTGWPRADFPGVTSLEYNLLFPVPALIWLILWFPNMSFVLCHLINC